MKKILSYTICIAVLATLVNNTSFAQSQPVTPTPQPIQSTGTTSPPPRPLTDQMMSDRMLKDLNTRNSLTTNQRVNWYQTDYGFFGNYAVGATNYMTRYDAQGNYVETLQRKEWNNNVPATLRNAYGQSPFKDQTVTGYWQVTDTGKSGYYMELREKNGNISRIWADNQGKFTTQPYSTTTSTPSNIPKD